jgi:hypothetical protein
MLFSVGIVLLLFVTLHHFYPTCRITNMDSKICCLFLSKGCQYDESPYVLSLCVFSGSIYPLHDAPWTMRRLDSASLTDVYRPWTPGYRDGGDALSCHTAFQRLGTYRVCRVFHENIVD